MAALSEGGFWQKMRSLFLDVEFLSGLGGRGFVRKDPALGSREPLLALRLPHFSPEVFLFYLFHVGQHPICKSDTTE